jgi:hypothetical protein
MKRFSQKKLKALVVQLNEIVAATGQDSAMDGLLVVSYAFAALLDAYALPNANNPDGMCDDPNAFRKVFADLIAAGSKKAGRK